MNALTVVENQREFEQRSFMASGTATSAWASERNMMLMLFSLSAMLFNHPRSHPWTTLPTSARMSVSVVVDRSSTISESLATAIVTETATIWKPLGIEIRGMGLGSVEPLSRVVHVIITDDPESDPADDIRLGWIRFVAPSEPEPVIHLSRFATRRLLGRVADLRQRPEAYRDVLLSRMMGRALAHELGHYLLASTAHTSHGLMRANWPIDLLITTDRAAFSPGRDEEYVVELLRSLAIS